MNVGEWFYTKDARELTKEEYGALLLYLDFIGVGIRSDWCGYNVIHEFRPKPGCDRCTRVFVDRDRDLVACSEERDLKELFGNPIPLEELKRMAQLGMNV